MPFSRSAYFALALSALCACSSNPVQVQSEASPNADLLRYHTYSWARHEKQMDPTLLMALRRQAERDLKEIGFTHVPAQGNPDILVGFEAVPTDQGPRLVMRFTEPMRNIEVWSGHADQVLARSESNPELAQKAVDRLVDSYHDFVKHEAGDYPLAPLSPV